MTLHRTAPPSAPVGVEGLVERMRQAPDRLWMADLVGQKISVERMRDILTFALAQQPVACPKCGGTGEADSGGVMPWGAPAMIPCDCQQPASDGGFTAADMMDARQEGRKEAQQPAAVDVALRAEVAAVRTLMDVYNIGGWTDAVGQMKRALAAEARAERLAEALRELVEVFSESGMYDEEVFAKARDALHPTAAQEDGNG